MLLASPGNLCEALLLTAACHPSLTKKLPSHPLFEISVSITKFRLGSQIALLFQTNIWFHILTSSWRQHYPVELNSFLVESIMNPESGLIPEVISTGVFH